MLLESPDSEKAHDFWRKSSNASTIQEVVSHGDDVSLVDLLAKLDRGESIEADQQEDEEYFKQSTVLQGSIPD